MGTGAELGTPRERLLETANRLFYAEGVHTVGIDRILAEAGVAKASLYKTFGSKDGLVAAYLASRHARTADRLTAAVEGLTDPRERLVAIFDSQAKLFDRPDYRGCAFVAASAETTGTASGDGPVESASAAYRSWVRELFLGIATDAGVADPQTLARRLQLVYDGSAVAARMDRDPAIGADAKESALRIFDDAVRAPADLPAQTS